MGRRAAIAVALLIGVVGFLAGRWTAPGAKTAHTTTTTAAPTTTVGPTLAVTPDSGGVGTTFTLAAHGLHPGSTSTFEVDFPDGHVFNGVPHPVGGDGTALATYTVTAGNPAGTYQAKVHDDEGAAAQGSFAVGGAGTSTHRSATTTTR